MIVPPGGKLSPISLLRPRVPPVHLLEDGVVLVHRHVLPGLPDSVEVLEPHLLLELDGEERERERERERGDRWGRSERERGDVSEYRSSRRR